MRSVYCWLTGLQNERGKSHVMVDQQGVGQGGVSGNTDIEKMKGSEMLQGS